jgi:hypothetical protein
MEIQFEKIGLMRGGAFQITLGRGGGDALMYKKKCPFPKSCARC